MLRLISYLAPSIPAEFFELAAKAISDEAGIEVDLQFEQRISGPLPGDVNPFATYAADVGFVCSPTFRWLADELDLLPVPVPSDNRAHGRPVYFADVIVRAESPYVTMKDLRGRRWAYNDRNSRSGWFSMIDRIAPLAPHEFFRMSCMLDRTSKVFDWCGPGRWMQPQSIRTLCSTSQGCARLQPQNSESSRAGVPFQFSRS